MARTFPHTPATAALEAAGVRWAWRQYGHSPRATSYGDEAAEALSVDADSVFKTLVVRLQRTAVIAVVPVTCSLSLKAVASVVSTAGIGPKARSATMADAQFAQTVTGYVMGGVSPFGTKTKLATIVDESAIERTSVFVSGGRRGFSVEVDPHDLVWLTEAIVAVIAR